MRKFFQLLGQALKGENIDTTKGKLDTVIFLLAVPMIFEMGMESLFAVVDIFFVSKVGVEAVAVVGLTESTLTIVYSIGFGLSMGATAMVARRVGENNPKGAAEAAMQAIYIGLAIAAAVSLVGIFFPENLLRAMGASDQMIQNGVGYTRWMLTGNFAIVLLFLNNGIFRGAGDAGIAMRSLIISNGINIVLDPLFIFGIWIFPELGVQGAAVATTIGRSIGVIYQFYHLTNGKSLVHLKGKIWQLKTDIVRRIVILSSGSAGQFIIASASWIFLMRIMSQFGEETLAGYTTAIRILVFSILPAWGISNAAATLMGQNLGANQPERAEKGVWRTAYFNMLFMSVVTVIFVGFPEFFMRIFNSDDAVVNQGVTCLRIVCIGYIAYGYEMVLANAINGAGDTRTPTIINVFGFWILQIPLAWFMAIQLDLGSPGVYAAVPISEAVMAVIYVYIFRQGKWKLVKI
ncbi:MAG TPA: MATE family efflux transporter [Chitinophagales bacterium]|nr:MATE family efflux transporter [Chitinophagales bacterium]